jgi:prepilin-type N-terminal cleavage/methylation domain-containing protein
MVIKMKIDWIAVTLSLHRILLAVTIWACHIWVAPTFRLFHRLAAAPFRSRRLHIDRVSSSEFKAQGFKPKFPKLQVHYSELFVKSQSGVAQIKSIPKFLVHGVKPSRGQKKVIENRPLNPLGVTLIELIAVMAMIGILAAAVIPRIDFGATSSQASVAGAAYMIASDIRYAQEFAMANRVSKSVQFSTMPPANVYTFSPTSNMDPSGQLPSGVTISTNYTVTFNSLGEPTTGGGGSVTVSAGGQSKTIAVVNYTGKVNIS